MGLTIHFTLKAPPETDAAGALDLVCLMRQRAQGFKQRGRVERVSPIVTDRKALLWAREYRDVPHPWHAGKRSGIEIPAVHGFMFFVEVGEDCEPLRLALGHYPKTVVMGGRRYRTELCGWRFRGFCKTQYASAHGWEHFRRCHTAVIDLLRGLGLGLEMSDEGDYWPGRRLDLLRKNLNEMNGVVAAAAGAMKDIGGAGVESPIFAHPQFERLEAEGAARVSPVLEKLRTAIGER